MQAEKHDRRVKYTRMVLRDSLTRLLQERTIDRVTVTALCEDADINRSTFYSHYRDQYDLLQQTQQEVLQELTDHLAAYSLRGTEEEFLQILQRIFEYIAENASLCQVLLADRGDVSLYQAIMSIVRKQIMAELRDTKGLDEDMIDYLLLFGVNGSMGIVQTWLQSGMKKTAREMAEVVVTLAYKGMTAYIR